MNTERNNKIWRLSSPIIVTLLVWVVLGLASGGPSAKAQTDTSQPIGTTQPVTVESTLKIRASGTVTDPSGTISVSGYVTVNCTRVIDTTLAGLPLVVLDIDYSNLRGTSGNSPKNQKVYITAGNQDSVIRPLQASDVIVEACPYIDSTKDILTANSWLVTLSLSWDLSTGKLTDGTATIGTKPASF